VSKARILFLCTGNSARSQMAEAFIRLYADEHFDPYSAGMEPKGINPYTIRVLEERGISLDGHTSDDLRTYLGHMYFGYVVTVCDHAEQNCPRSWLQAQNHIHWGFEDPAAFEGTDEEKLARFREVRDQIETQVCGWLMDQGIPVEKREVSA
jgi:arsenate reductase